MSKILSQDFLQEKNKLFCKSKFGNIKVLFVYLYQQKTITHERYYQHIQRGLSRG